MDKSTKVFNSLSVQHKVPLDCYAVVKNQALLDFTQDSD